MTMEKTKMEMTLLDSMLPRGGTSRYWEAAVISVSYKENEQYQGLRLQQYEIWTACFYYLFYYYLYGIITFVCRNVYSECMRHTISYDSHKHHTFLVKYVSTPVYRGPLPRPRWTRKWTYREGVCNHTGHSHGVVQLCWRDKFKDNPQKVS